MTLVTPNLINEKKEWFWVVAVAVFLISVQLLFHYDKYNNFTTKEKHFLNAKVINQYTKNDYKVLKLKSKDLTFYTTSRKNIKNLTGQNITLLIFTNHVDISFQDYLTQFYAPSHIIKTTTAPKNAVQEFINSQHTNPKWQEFYGAIFLAKPVSKELREFIAKFGISHLIALSGFHIAILSGIIYFLLKPVYRFFHIRYFPYRYELLDLGFIVAFLLGYYLYTTDFPPSLVRSYAMFSIGLILLLFGVSFLSYSFLFFVALLVVIFDVSMLFSLSFFFSLSGVFYIYLFLDNFKQKSKLFITVGITLWTFLAMNPIVHYFFDSTSLYQLFSPLLTILFSIFYPLTLFLHLIGFGNLLDFNVSFNLSSYSYLTPSWFFYFYLLLSLLAIKKVFKPYLLVTVVLFNLYLFLV